MRDRCGQVFPRLRKSQKSGFNNASALGLFREEEFLIFFRSLGNLSTYEKYPFLGNKISISQ